MLSQIVVILTTITRMIPGLTKVYQAWLNNKEVKKDRKAIAAIRNAKTKKDKRKAVKHLRSRINL